jgi:zinc protease
MLSTPTFAKEEVDIDRTAVITSKETQRNEPASIAVASLRKHINGHEKGHPLAYQTIDEEIAGLNKVTPARLKKLHATHMAFANGHIGVVGDVNPQEINAKLEERFGPINGGASYNKMDDKLVDVQGVDSWIETPDKANSSLFIGHRIDLNKQHPDYYAALVANSIFGGSGFASRLMQRIRVKEGYSYGTGSGLQLEFNEPYGLFYMRAIAAPENMKKVVKAYKEEVSKAKNEGFTQKEVDDAKAGELKSLRVSWSSDGYIANLIAENKEIKRDLAWYTEFEQKLSEVTLEQANDAFKKYIATDDLNIFTAGDFAKSAEK